MTVHVSEDNPGLPHPSPHELLLTISDREHDRLTDDVQELRNRYGTWNVTQTILEAVRRQVEAEDASHEVETSRYRGDKGSS